MLKSAHQTRVEEFHRLGGHAVPSTPTVPDQETRYRRAKLIFEECLETLEALGFYLVSDEYGDPALKALPVANINLAHLVKELSDLSVVTTGTFSTIGVPDEPYLAIVDESNTAKVRNGVRYNEFGKILKPDGWVNPEKLITDQLEAK